MISIFPKFPFSAAAGFLASSVSSTVEFTCPGSAVDMSANTGLTAKVSIRKEHTVQVRIFLKSFGLTPLLRSGLIFIRNPFVLNDGSFFQVTDIYNSVFSFPGLN
ncbi:hypothetical protein EO98_00230 [Methanosarcina sp. 2.H.T.1A.6]|nr:hypothetical protein EO94_02525 [Methanosarcina sp. 2.H.T.1A.3]KKG22561.1 hypothetical protein EO97_01365 [Methanosarcina sp. 2.H.T.1A.15]KKG23907.1 hypothetical protein EO98_00230 [Methanosarcina sp. 2.H.T.1A.6]KKG26455.1 hypothetical protein EO96_05870 [Methanosarcina sp. 2.H.T.1A.8]